MTMRDVRFFSKPLYANSYALIIGIDHYKSAPPLSYAVSDAMAIRDLLAINFEFPAENVTFLTNDQATRATINQAFHRFGKADIGIDDRIFVFYAGHGHTAPGTRGEIGYLVPHDADLEDKSTLIRWDDLARASEGVRAKHVLFIMDACYGGLMLMRSPSSGSTRFVNDMMTRYSRQVLTAGKADEVVADAGGPIPEHSVFTGHLIQALEGAAAAEEGILTASAVMAYTYTRVSQDRNSQQTPHYGHIDGDGDFVFRGPPPREIDAAKDDSDVLVSMPIPNQLDAPETRQEKINRVKELLSDAKGTIALHEMVIAEVRQFLASTVDDRYPMSVQFSVDEFTSRLEHYEDAVSILSDMEACIAYWATSSNHIGILQKAYARSCDRIEPKSGLPHWLALRWYPLIISLYKSGISAIDARRYETLAAIFNVTVPEANRPTEHRNLLVTVGDAISEISSSNLFKSLPGHERQYTPMSEYLFKNLQPQMDELLFLGKSYEQAFDTFEVLFALSIADRRTQVGEHLWGPVGRFGWKARSQHMPPLKRVKAEADAAGDDWGPLRAGLFNGKMEQFSTVWYEYSKAVGGLPWH